MITNRNDNALTIEIVTLLFGASPFARPRNQLPQLLNYSITMGNYAGWNHKVEETTWGSSIGEGNENKVSKTQSKCQSQRG